MKTSAQVFHGKVLAHACRPHSTSQQPPFYLATTMNIEEILAHPAFWIVLAAASEIIALSPLRDNSVIQLVFHALRSLKAKKG